MSREDLPSIDDLVNNDLPSVEDFITEENAEELPSVQDFIVEEKEEIIETVEEVEEEPQIDLTEVIRLINDVRKDIPDIPEVKYYDQELEQLSEKISSLPEVRYYDREVEAICEQIDLVREQVKDLPEVKYYDEQVDAIEDRIDSLQTDVANLPEVKYYDSELEAICEAIDEVKASIPKFPKWVNEVNEVPDFSWIGKTFSVIDDDFVKVNDTIEGLRGKIQFDIEQLSEDVETKYFNNTVKIESNVKDLDDKVNVRIDEEKDKIWKELRSSSMKIWEYHKEFKDDDRKLKKQILGEYNSLKQNINKELKEINYTSTKTDELLLKYFTELREEISGLPEVKYYDKDIDYVKSDIKGLYKIVEEIRSSQKQLKEEQQLLAETNVPLGEDPPDTKNPDPLTPIDQNFVTLDQLQQHYKRFVERVQYQLGSIGGGGAGFIHDLDDVQVGSAVTNGSLLIYDSSIKKYIGIASTALSGGAASELAENCTGTNLTVTNLTVTGIATQEDVRNIDAIGILTARSGVKVTGGGLDVVGVSTISTGVGTIHVGVGSTALLVEGDARVTGILTIGQGSITLDPNTKQVTGIDEIVVGSGASLSLAPLFNSSGKFVVDYSSLTLKGYNSNNEGTYERQSTSFVLGTAPTTSGSARFQETSGYYYFLHESDNSKIIIFNIVTGNWDAVHSSGSNFSSPSSGTLVNPVSNYSFVTPVRASFDDTGRAYPGSGFGVVYKTTVAEQTQSIGIATASSLVVSGIATVSTAFYMPQYTTSARDAATFNEGAMIYNTTTKKMEFYDGTSWTSLPGMSLGLTVALDG